MCWQKWIVLNYIIFYCCKCYLKGSLECLLVACNRGKLDVWIPTVAEFVLENLTVEEVDKDTIFDRITKFDVLKVYPWEVCTVLSKIMPCMWWVKDQIYQGPRCAVRSE